MKIKKENNNNIRKEDFRKLFPSLDCFGWKFSC